LGHPDTLTVSRNPEVARARTTGDDTRAQELRHALPPSRALAPDPASQDRCRGKISNGKVEVEQDNFYFEKTFLKGTAGTVTVKLENEGNTQHSFTIDDQDIDAVVQPGKTKTVTVKLTDGQPVSFYCKFHRSSGMQGALYTAAGGTTSSTG
jgi:plastocyanin